MAGKRTEIAGPLTKTENGNLPAKCVVVVVVVVEITAVDVKGKDNRINAGSNVY